MDMKKIYKWDDVKVMLDGVEVKGIQSVSYTIEEGGLKIPVTNSYETSIQLTPEEFEALLKFCRKSTLAGRLGLLKEKIYIFLLPVKVFISDSITFVKNYL